HTRCLSDWSSDVCSSDLILASVSKTGRVIVVDTAWTSCGTSAEIAARVAEELGGSQRVRVQRIGYEPVTCPATSNLEHLYYPNQIGRASCRERVEIEVWA